MKFQIKNSFTLDVMFEFDAETLRLGLEVLIKSGADLSGANLSRANLSGANLPGAYLSRADLSGADLSRANLSRANLSGANLSGAYLSGAYLFRADLFRADLSGANLSGANLSGVDLSRADLSGADLSGAYLFGEKLTKNPIQLLGLKYNFILITKVHIKIGCKLYKAEEWFKFNDEEISDMELNALVWWKKYKSIIRELHSEHCKVGTENE